MKRILISSREHPGKLKKMQVVLKCTVLFVLIGVFNLQAGTMAQNGQEIVLSMKNVELRDVLWEIEHQTSFTFMYNRQDLDKVGKVSVDLKSKSIDEVLKVCLKNTGLIYIVQDDVIVLKPNNAQGIQEVKQVRVTGRVCGTDSVPLPGVTVRVKGTTYGTVTDIKGKYNIDIPDTKGTTLVFSFIGMKSVEVKYTSQKEINITMLEEVKELEEVTVQTGYQKIEKRYLTSSVTTIKASDILVPGMSSIDQMLEGHVPGMIFMQNSGQLGAAPRLRIRGTSTILGSQEPLWVVDGIVQTEPVNVDPSQINDLDFVNLLGNAISGLNPMDIEQIDILKDASATALYGARAANGVIVITTKRGSVGEPSVSYSFSGTFSQRPRYSDRSVNMMNSSERVDFSREVVEKRLGYGSVDTWVGYDQAIRDYYSGKIDFATFKQEVNRYESVNTDWFDLLMKDSFSHDHTLSISGGTDKVKYYASVGYNNQDGVLRKEMNKRYTTNMKITANLNRFMIQVGLQGNISEKRYTPQAIGLTDYAYNTTRAVPAFDEHGDLTYYSIASGSGVKKFNILNERDNSYDKIDGNGITFNAVVDYRIFDALKAGVMVSYSSNNTYQSIYRGEKTYYAAMLREKELGEEPDLDSKLPYGGEIQDDNTKNDSYTFRGQLDFNKFLDKDNRHLLMITLGGEVSSNEYTGLKQTRRAYVPERGNLVVAVDPKYTTFVQWLATDPAALGIRKNERTRMASTYASASYSYNDLYVLNVNARIDASNKFGSQTNDKLLPIWSVSGRWNAAEDVLRNVAWVNTLALRASFGYQGNMLDSETPELIIQRMGMNTVYDKYESIVKSFPNPNLKWEKTASFNTSVDFSFLNDKIQGTLSYYYKKTTDAFLAKTISVINGRPSYTVNKGTLENQGYDISFNFNPVKTMNGRDGFSWRIDPQIGQVLNQLISKATNQKDKVLRDEIKYKDYLDGNVEVSGRPLNTFYSYKFTGLDPNDGRPLFDGISEMVERDGEEVERDVIYSGMSKDEVYMSVMEHSGTRVPFIQGGIYNTFSYKGFILSFNLTYSFGSKVRLLNMYPDVQTQYASIAPRPLNNARKEFVNRWRTPGDEKRTDIPGLLVNDEFRKTLDPWWKGRPYAFAENIWEMYDHSNLRVVSGNYLKMQSLNLRYVFPEEFCKKLLLKSAYVGLSGSNLFTICAKELKGQDPTQSGSSDKANLSVRPTYSINLSVTF